MPNKRISIHITLDVDTESLQSYTTLISIETRDKTEDLPTITHSSQGVQIVSYSITNESQLFFNSKKDAIAIPNVPIV